MPRGGKRAGAGRPRKMLPASNRVKRVLQDGSRVEWEKSNGQLLTVAVSGEHAQFLMRSLFDRLQAELPHDMALSQLEDLLTDPNAAIALSLVAAFSPGPVHRNENDNHSHVSPVNAR